MRHVTRLEPKAVLGQTSPARTAAGPVRAAARPTVVKAAFMVLVDGLIDDGRADGSEEQVNKARQGGGNKHCQPKMGYAVLDLRMDGWMVGDEEERRGEDGRAGEKDSGL